MGDFRHMTQGWDRRLSNIVLYKCPGHKGFNFTAAYQMPQAEVGEQTDTAAYSTSLMYSKAGLMDEADPALLGRIVSSLEGAREDAWIDIHALRAWRSDST